MFQTFPDKTAWRDAAVAEIVKDLPESGAFSLALCGGSTPTQVYEALAKKQLEWKSAHIFQSDERFISGDREESNQLLIENYFLKNLPAQPHTHFFATPEKMSWEQSAEKYDRELRDFGKPFDVCILGIGPDGHIASLFPNEPALEEIEKLATTSETNQFAVWKRLTLTFPSILNAKKIVVLLRGNEKKTVMEELEQGEKEWTEFPAKKLLAHPDIHFFLCSL